MLFSKSDVKQLSKGETYQNKIVVLKPEYVMTFKPQYQSMEYQLFFARSGFGCDPEKMGNGVYGLFCGDGESARVERYEILGVATDEAIEAYTKLYHKPIVELPVLPV